MQAELTYSKQFGLSWYSCGPTVYSHSHLGHGRCYVTLDAIRNALQNWFKVPVSYWMNITDIDDKIIAGAAQQKMDHRELSARWEAAFLHKMDALNVRRPDRMLRVSQHLPEIIDYIEKIISNGYAYSVGGNVYFDVEKFQGDGHRYCKLQSSAYQVGGGLDPANQYAADKRHQADFALWKAGKPGEPNWHSPWGKGRPGWHIECSAIIQTYLQPNQTLDLHTGGSDLRFPHHSNEIAQGEAHDCSHHWVNFFLHVAPLTISGLKMSKSLKNFITVEDALKEASGDELRLLFLSHHYSKVMQYNPEGSVLEARAISKSLVSCIRQIENRLSTNPLKDGHDQDSLQPSEEHIQEARNRIDSMLRKDLDFPAVIKEIVHLAKQVEKQSQLVDLDAPAVARGRDLILEVADGVLGLKLGEKAKLPVLSPSKSEALLGDFIKYRERIIHAARGKDLGKVFELSDEVRDRTLPSYGVQIEDEQPRSQKATTSAKPRIDPPEAQTSNLTRQTTQHASLFESPKYAKFKIGRIGADGLPELDIEGKRFPQKVMDRFKRDLQSHQTKS